MGKLPYDIKLRAPEDKKKKVQSFSAAAADSFGSVSSGKSSFFRRSSEKEDTLQSQHSVSSSKDQAEEEKFISPLKKTGVDETQKAAKEGSSINRTLFQEKNMNQQFQRKRKAKGSGGPLLFHNLKAFSFYKGPDWIGSRMVTGILPCFRRKQRSVLV